MVRAGLIALAAAGVAAALAIGLSQGGSGSSAARVPRLDVLRELRTRLAGSPAPLARLHAQAAQVLPGGPRAFDARLRRLRGHPVVVNAWASWCHPCRAEFPVFQRTGIALGRRVAFLGLDTQDNAAKARAYLRALPLPYPSYGDSGAAVLHRYNTVPGLPTTVFFDHRGHRTFIHQGPYASVAALRADIGRYAT